MQKRITDMEAKISKQGEGIKIYEPEKDGLNDTLIRTRTELDKSIVNLIASRNKTAGENILDKKTHKNKGNRNVIVRDSLIPNDYPQTGLRVARVAFSTYLSNNLNNLDVGHVIKLDESILNHGNGYNRTSGIFTVPTSGVYLLTYIIDNNSKNNTLEVEIVVDNKHMG